MLLDSSVGLSFLLLAKYFKVYIINIKDNYICLVKILPGCRN